MRTLYVISGVTGMTGSELVHQIIENESDSFIIGFDNFFASSIDSVADYINHPRFYFKEYEHTVISV